MHKIKQQKMKNNSEYQKNEIEKQVTKVMNTSKTGMAKCAVKTAEHLIKNFREEEIDKINKVKISLTTGNKIGLNDYICIKMKCPTTKAVKMMRVHCAYLAAVEVAVITIVVSVIDDQGKVNTSFPESNKVWSYTDIQDFLDKLDAVFRRLYAEVRFNADRQDNINK